MIKCNIYSGRKGELYYQFTDNFNSLIEAEMFAQEISEMDANEFGYPIDDCRWLAIETEKDDLPEDKRVEIGCN